MKVTCQICKSKIEKDTAYKRVVGKVNKYYCSEQEWQAEEDKKKKAAEDKDKVYRLICEILGEEEIISTSLYKEWVVWNKVANNEKIGYYLEENREYLSSVIGRLQSSEFAKIRYLSTIIRDKIKGFVPKPKVEEVSIIEVSSETLTMHVNTKKVKRRRGFAEEDDE